MKRLFTLLIVKEYSVFCFAQTVTLKFTGRDANGQYCPLNQVTINNLSQNWQETLNWPDTTLILNNEVGVSDYMVPVLALTCHRTFRIRLQEPRRCA